MFHQEQSTISSLCYSGSLSGLIITLPICSALAKSGFLGGWPSTFYVFGFLGVVWFVVWMFCVHDTPDKHPTITTQEVCGSLCHFSISTPTFRRF